MICHFGIPNFLIPLLDAFPVIDFKLLSLSDRWLRKLTKAPLFDIIYIVGKMVMIVLGSEDYRNLW